MIFEVIVRALIHDGEGRILIGRKRRDIPHPLQGRWHFIGGRLEYDEDPWNAVVREVEEEVGIKVRPVRLIDAYPEFLVWPMESGIPSQYTLHLVFECMATTLETVKPSDDVEEAKWIRVEELRDYLDDRESLLRSSRVVSFIELLKGRGDAMPLSSIEGLGDR
ncbi:MAG: NUDIX domain-containing protein [Candidatus Nezhaarchaeales archaeon]